MTRTNALTTACLIAAAGLAHAQTSAERTRQETERRAAEASRNVPQLRQGGPAVRTDPEAQTTPSRPGLTEGIDWLAGLDENRLGVRRPTVLAERTFLNRREGWLLKGDAGSFVFVPLTEGRVAGEGVMRLMPSLELERIESSVSTEPGPIPYVLTGQIFVFDGRNHVLPSAGRRSNREGLPGETLPEPSAMPEELNDPDVADIIEQIRESERRSSAALDETERQRFANAPALVPGDEPSDNLIPEGTYLSEQRGRLDRAGDGILSLTLDSDTAAEGGSSGEVAASEQRLRLLPCRLTETLAGVMEFRRDTPAVLVSGRVYSYNGQNYLLPTLYRLENNFGVDARQ
ncbi:MAG: hypothetical protein AAGI17_08475 [Planctomycetota bacterium]